MHGPGRRLLRLSLENRMLANNPFNELAGIISPGVMKAYVVLMILLVIGGTLLDMRHKQSAKYFFENSKKAQKTPNAKLAAARKPVWQ